MTDTATVGFAPDEIDLTLSTRAARLKWVVVVDESLPPGLAVNAAVCAAAATSAGVTGLRGPDVVDAGSSTHPGLPWIGCTVLVATREQLAALRVKADASEGVHVADMPVVAQETRVHAEYQASIEADPAPALLSVSIVGPRNRVDKLTKGLGLMP